MQDFKELSNTDIIKLINQRIEEMHHYIGDELYPSLMHDIRFHKSEEAQEHMKVKHYQAIDRINMFIAYKVVGTTFYNYELNEYAKNRKVLKKILNAINGIDYNQVREMWHNELKDVFYKQKEEKRFQEKLEKICIIGRTTVDGVTGFIKMINDKITTTPNMAEATEFTATSDNDSAIQRIEALIQCNDSTKLFFNNKVKGRNSYNY